MRFEKTLSYFVSSICALGFTLWFVTPTPAEITRVAMGSDRALLAANGELIQSLRTDFTKRRLAWLELSEFSGELQRAVLASEDRRFYSHFGVDPVGLGRALAARWNGAGVQGASTVTMQLADLIQPAVLAGTEKIKKGSYFHKVAQVWRAWGLELRWSKSEILEAYLNLIHLRGEYQGVPAMARAYLDKSPAVLELAEGAMIAASISSPNLKREPLARKACALFRRLTSESESCAGVERAVLEAFRENPSLPAEAGIAPHLARRLLRENPNEVIVRSSIDAGIQKKVLAILAKNILALRDKDVKDAAAIVIDNKTGRVLAYVGAVPTSESPHVDGVTSARQAGSTLKPFLYGKAIDDRTITAASILLDDPTAISWAGGVYRPANYDRNFHGPVSAREALASSLNVPAVKIVTIVGLHETYRVIQNLGITGLREPDFYGVSMALGAVEVKLEELANAYRMLANGGRWSPLTFAAAGDTAKDARPVFTPEAAFVVGSILSDANARSIGFGWRSPLETGFWSASKTGTSKDYRDNWCVGFSERYTVGVWAGNFDARAMRKVSGVSGAGPSWNEIMSYLHAREKSLEPPPPAGIVAKEVRHSWMSHARREYFLKGTEPAGELIEPAPDQQVRFVFPAEGSVLVLDPRQDSENVSLTVRWTGTAPEGAHLRLAGKDLGIAASPFRLGRPPLGTQKLELVDAQGAELASVRFRVRGEEDSTNPR